MRYHTYEVLKAELNNPRIRWAYLPYSMHMAGEEMGQGAGRQAMAAEATAQGRGWQAMAADTQEIRLWRRTGAPLGMQGCETPRC